MSKSRGKSFLLMQKCQLRQCNSQFTSRTSRSTSRPRGVADAGASSEAIGTSTAQHAESDLQSYFKMTLASEGESKKLTRERPEQLSEKLNANGGNKASTPRKCMRVTPMELDATETANDASDVCKDGLDASSLTAIRFYD